MIGGGDDGDDDAVAGFDFFYVGDAFFVACDGIGIVFVAGGEDDDREIFVDEGVGAVLHFSGGIAFGVDVGDFFEFEGAFERDGIVNAATQVKKIGVAEELAGEIFVK